jgi:hypothetical protein
MTDHKQMIFIISEELLKKEKLEIVFSDDPGEQLGADANFFYTEFILKGGSPKYDFELVKHGSYLAWETKGELVAAYALKYAGAYDIAIKICRWHMNENLELPAALRRFGAEALVGNITKPKERILGKGRDKNWMRNEIFVRYMKFLVDTCEYKPQRNPASGHNSAADILAAAFNECGYEMITYDTILNVWKDKTFREELSALFGR